MTEFQLSETEVTLLEQTKDERFVTPAKVATMMDINNSYASTLLRRLVDEDIVVSEEDTRGVYWVDEDEADEALAFTEQEGVRAGAGRNAGAGDETRRSIVRAMEGKRFATPSDVADEVGKHRGYLSGLMRGLVDDGVLQQEEGVRGVYWVDDEAAAAYLEDDDADEEADDDADAADEASA